MLWWWIFFAFFILAMLALDLGVFNRKSHVIKMKEAMLWTLFWVTLALLFGTGIYFFYGHGKAMEFLAGYLIEYSLSIDNLFVFMLIFRFFNVPRAYEHKALFWGILMALATRAVFIFAGVALINTFSWVMYIFGAFLIFTGIKMALNKQTEVHPDKNIAIKLLRYVIPVTSRFSGARFFVVKRGVRHATRCWLTPWKQRIFFLVIRFRRAGYFQDPFIIYTSML